MKGYGFVLPTRDAPPAAHPLIGAAIRPSAHAVGVPILWNQLNTERCAGFAVEQAAHCYLQARSIPHEILSPTFPWWCANRERGKDDSDVRDEGIDPYTFVDACARFGAPELKYWDPPVSQVTLRPVDVAFQRAQTRKLRVSPIYETGSARLERIYDGLAQDLPIVIAKPADASYEENDGPLIIGPIVGAPLGQHMTCLYAYKSDGNVVEVGSWGPWRDNGKAELTPDCVIQSVKWCATVEVIQ